ncbi:pyridoxal phosphate-dependent aminotransferase [Peredibacter starrii]|uniref:Aminotransferase class I/II-fold pyridoxal phosphate-dependent enzyme n=1 Tax=Peredibacter starrii TaxID=28202 RepID=A0AAX4HMA5_9BACT|nr:aminotransferase class I/II-fold pyridoxal phosphate-dependent enzyme [Peredibacter starrii]WPU64399.1 aminotransferase class I/II-fold pyridoxal phosphate-dependent enzyme [Peredibacter starrii]
MKLNEKAIQLTEEGKVIYNLSGGQLPIKPVSEFIEKIHHQLNFLKSYQYSPSAGFPALRKKLLKFFTDSRRLSLETVENDMDVIVSNGSKHSIYNALGAIIDPGDEVILLAPYWVSYPEMIKFWGGVPMVVKSNVFDAFVPAIEDIRKIISPRTKAIIVNSPNNPSGVHYSESWMREFAELLKENPHIVAISDEVYSDISYFDPKPTYFYQFDRSLLERTIIVHAISKTLAATGLRIGWAIAPADVVQAMGRIQGQTTSGPNSLAQRALLDFDLHFLESFLTPVKNHIRTNAATLREKFREANLGHCWYQSTSAFYFMIDFSRTPMFKRFPGDEDHSYQIADELLNNEGITVVPGVDFGIPNTARISLVIEEVPFQEAITKIVRYLNKF